ncbi:TonB-dependent hemoglobin/transferrin/lactoferrin family receptor [Roseibacillus persicicus]|uniref:TonB-dependent hemoglobin/transferrin/lactoferrin family receptor n=1 Tax=Roseibacillus persicicus TaxID=454148 RepID=UPI00398B5E7E
MFFRPSVRLVVATTASLSLTPSLFAQELELEETVVVASRLEEEESISRASSSSTISAENILQTGATNLTDAFKYEPGVSIPFDFAGTDGLIPYLSGGDSGINIRGLEGNRISIDVDGIRQPDDFISKSFEGSGGPGRIYFDPATFAEVELHKSAANSSTSSDALGGAVSGRTESALTLLGPELEGFALRDSVTFSSVNESIHNRLATALGNGRAAASVLYSYRQGQERRNNSFYPANPADFESDAVVATLNWRPSDDALLTATADFYRARSFVDVNSAEGDTGQGIFNTLLTSDDLRERLRFSLDLELTAPTPLYDSLKTTAYWQRAEAATDNVQQGVAFGGLRDYLNDIDYQTEISGLQLQATKEISRHQLSYGIEGSYSQVESSFFRTQRFTSGGSIVQDLIGMAPSDVIRGGLFVKDRVRFGANDELEITPAIRLDHYSVDPENTAAFLSQSNGQEAAAFDNFSISPSLSLAYHVTDQVSIFGSWAQGTRNPSAEELNGVFSHTDTFITVPNPDLSEERSNSFELGLDYSSDLFNSKLAGYYNLYSDFLENGVLLVDNPPGTPDELTTVNRGEVEIYGLEFSADWNLGEQFSFLEGLTVGGSLSWSEGHADDGEGSGDEPLNSIEPWKSVAYLAYHSPSEKWGSTLTATYAAAKDLSDIDDSDGTDFLPADSWLTLDLTAYYQLSENVRLRGGISNLLDEDYILWATARRGTGHGGNGLPNSFYTQPGRAFFLSCDLTF